VDEKGTLVTVRFSDLRGKTKVNFRQGPFSNAQSRDGHRGGWSECFDRLQSLLQISRAAA
jgi:uncharacterized protein YndB with AHSA1/START domain